MEKKFSNCRSHSEYFSGPSFFGLPVHYAFPYTSGKNSRIPRWFQPEKRPGFVNCSRIKTTASSRVPNSQRSIHLPPSQVQCRNQKHAGSRVARRSVPFSMSEPSRMLYRSERKRMIEFAGSGSTGSRFLPGCSLRCPGWDTASPGIRNSGALRHREPPGGKSHRARCSPPVVSGRV